MSVVLIGSSGGGTAGAGYNDVVGFIKTLERQLHRAGLVMVGVQVVGTADCQGLDFVQGPLEQASVQATLYHFCTEQGRVSEDQDGGRISALDKLSTVSGSLHEVNVAAARVDESLERLVKAGKVDAVLSVSSDPGSVNNRIACAAIAAKLPWTGTGGTSIAKLLSMGATVVNAGGSVATTSFSRAVSLAACTAYALRHEYVPEPTKLGEQQRVRSVMCSLQPAFLTVALLNKIGLFQGRHQLLEVGLPCLACVAVVHDLVGKDMGPLDLMSGIIVGMQSSLVVSVACGYLIAYVLPTVLVVLIRARLPATACSILAVLASCLAGVSFGFVLEYFSELANDAGFSLATMIRFVATSPTAGGMTNIILCYGSKHGYYHLAALPLILIEMQHGEFSFIGALDYLALCVVGAAICSAAYLKTRSGRALRGSLANFIGGDFVEACYPYCEADRAVTAAAYSGAFLSGFWLCRAQEASELQVCLSTAYVPAPLAIAVSNCPMRLAEASLFAFAPPFLVALVKIN